MLLVLEYLRRTGELYEYVSLPCSLFINTKNYDTKIAVTIKDSNNSKVYVRHWFLSSCSKDRALPTIKDYCISKKDLFSDPAIMIGAFELLNYRCSGVRLERNIGNGGHPMSLDLYKKYLNNILYSGEHAVAKEGWLWHAFLSVYFKASTDFIFQKRGYGYFVYGEKAYGELISELQLRQQQEKVRTYFKRLWKNWELWKRYMLFEEKVAGELIFSDIYEQI